MITAVPVGVDLIPYYVVRINFILFEIVNES